MVLNSIAKSILILTFENLSGNKKDEFLSNSVPIEITHLLSKYKNLKVISNVSSVLLIDQPDQQKKLKVDLILKGSFLKISDHIRLNIQLIDNKDGTCLLSIKLEEKSNNIFDLIDKVSAKIIQQLDPIAIGLEFISQSNRTKIGGVAYVNYLKGLQYWNLWNLDNVKKAIINFEKVIELEPNFPLGYARLSHCYALLATLDATNCESNYNVAKKAALRAVELNDSILEAHLSLALIKLLNDVDIIGTYYSLEKAFSIDNSSPETHYYYAFYLLVIGKYHKAVEALEYTLESDPLNPQVNSSYGFALSLLGKYDLAEQQLKKTLSLHPDSIPTYDALIWNYILNNQLEKAKELVENATIEISLSPATQIVIYHRLGLSSETKKWWNQLDKLLKNNPINSKEASISYLELGDIKNGIKHFESFFKQKTGFIRALTHPAWKKFRESDRFYLYKKRLKLLNAPTLPSNLTEITEDIIVLHSTTAESITIPSKDLLYIESQGMYSKIVYRNASGELKEKILRTSLNAIINETLNQKLYRCHHSFIVNTSIPYAVTGNRKNLKIYIIEYDFRIPVSRSKASEVHDYLKLLD